MRLHTSAVRRFLLGVADDPQLSEVLPGTGKCPDRTRPDTPGRHTVTGRPDDPRSRFSARFHEALGLCGRTGSEIAQRTSDILAQRASLAGGGASARTTAGRRRVDRKRISDWSNGRDLPGDQETLEAVVKALLEAMRRQQTQGRIDPAALTPGLLEEQAWMTWWRAARGAPKPELWLTDYLQAVREAAESHPYPGLLPHATLPSLSQVYVRQRSRPRPAPDHAGVGTPADTGIGTETSRAESASDDVPAEARPAAEAILSADHDVLLLGGPGAGKSSLLRHALITLATGGPATGVEEIPVYVPASYLTTRGSSFAEQLAAAARDDLSGRRVPPFSAEVFDRPPRPAARWLVLVDGLDEITDVRQRVQLSRQLRENRRGPHRFVLTSRPLPDRELEILEQHPHLRTYELLPFDSQQLRDFADSWMRTARLPDPQASVRAFLAQVDAPPLAELARTPLLATILCQLHAARPDRALPRDRYSIYESFLGLLRRRLHDPEIPGLPDAILAALADAATGQHRASGGNAPPDLLTAVMDATDDLCPSHLRMLPRDWAARREDLLRRTGLVTVRDGGYAFIHETIGEYLTARHVAVDARLSRQAFNALFGRRGTVTPKALSSYHLFLIAAWCGNPPPPGRPPLLTATLNRLAAGRDGIWCVAQLAADQVALEPHVVESATGALKALAADSALDGNDRVKAARALAAMGDARTAETWAALAADAALDRLYRGWVTKALAEGDVPQGRELLAELATNPTADDICRVDAVEALEKASDPRAAPLWSRLAADPTVKGFHHFRAAARVARAGDPQAAALWVRLATDPALDDDARVAAASVLSQAGDPRGRDLLATLATDPALEGMYRGHAVRQLEEAGDPQAATLWRKLATDPTLDDYHRVKAAEALAEMDDPRIIELWAGLAGDSTLDGSYRVAAARELDQRGDPRGRDLLAAFAGDSTLGGLARVDAAYALVKVDDPQGRDLLATLAADPALDGFCRICARLLAKEGETRAVELWATLAFAVAEPVLDDFSRREVAEARAELSRPQIVGLWVALATDPALSGPDRAWAVHLLGQAHRWSRWRSRITAWIVRCTGRLCAVTLRDSPKP
ncbi:NACHT domain-containing protein [Nonomuraea sp. NPDC048826]|uniref:NACHT domain-containing protein n=1 Tax=Nonomuraea sp. NPDC048826 TaxID=3364347 RepID=UPI00371ED4A2